MDQPASGIKPDVPAAVEWKDMTFGERVLTVILSPFVIGWELLKLFGTFFIW